ncbi:cullin-1-like isoform X2 [Cornus florida]|uniref:cullin-1-like isoform X2 n=1 Tax=Cornus florida TaxID=4283 RepID=UPI002898C138|nr:cullin-1-like isoform X2 [Cornus florida]
MWKLIKLEEGLNVLEEAIVKARLLLDGHPTNTLFTPEEYIKFYDCVYFMCIQHDPYDYSIQLYERFNRALEESIFSRVLPSLVDKNDASLLIELLRMWTNYKVMTKCLGGLFLYLDRHFPNGKNAASLNDVSVQCFRDLVCNEFYQRFQNAAVSLIGQDRDGKLIDRDLLKNTMTFFMEIGGCGNTSYYDNFEKVMLADSAAYYSQLASNLLICNSSADYVMKVEWCLNQEEERASQYLCQTTVERLLQQLLWRRRSQSAGPLGRHASS